MQRWAKTYMAPYDEAKLDRLFWGGWRCYPTVLNCPTLGSPFPGAGRVHAWAEAIGHNPTNRQILWEKTLFIFYVASLVFHVQFVVKAISEAHIVNRACVCPAGTVMFGLCALNGQWKLHCWVVKSKLPELNGVPETRVGGMHPSHIWSQFSQGFQYLVYDKKIQLNSNAAWRCAQSGFSHLIRGAWASGHVTRLLQRSDNSGNIIHCRFEFQWKLSRIAC